MSRKEPLNWTIEGELTPERRTTIRQALASLGLSVIEHEVESPQAPDIRAEQQTATIFSKEQFMGAFRDKLGKEGVQWPGKAWTTLKYHFLYDVRVQDPQKDLSFEEMRWGEPFIPRRNHRPSGLRFYQSGGEGTLFDSLDVGSLMEFVDNVHGAIIELGKQHGMEAVMGRYRFEEPTLAVLREFAVEHTSGEPDV